MLIAAFALTGLVVWRSATAAVDRDIRRTVKLEVEAISHELDAEGLDAAVAAVAARADRPGAPEYWFTDSQGRRLAGDLSQMEGPNGWRRFSLRSEDGAGMTDMIVLTKSFPSGVRLSVGGDLSAGRLVVNKTLISLAEVGALAAALIVILGAIVTRMTLRRIDDLASVFRRVGAGEIGARSPTRTSFLAEDLDRISDGVNAMLDRNQELVDGLRRVSRDIAHDLRTPLSHLRQRLQRARAATADGKDAEIDAADDKVAEIIKTFDAILRLAEIEAGAVRARFSQIDLAEIAETAVDAYRPDIEASGRSIAFKAPAPAILSGDRDLVFQAIANLIENAMRHTPPRTAIEVGAVAGDRPSIFVKDNGGGIPIGRIDEAIKPFARLDPSRQATGTGLGLSIAAAIAALHGGALRLDDAKPGLNASIDF